VYWTATLLLGTENVVGGLMAIFRWTPYAAILKHLGYPEYFMVIIGIWYTAAGVILLAPRFPRLKEWAYAGLVINFTGAAASHMVAGDPVGALVAPTLFTGLAITSWALRPPARRLAGPVL
jgi:DoxX-like family